MYSMPIWHALYTSIYNKNYPKTLPSAQLMGGNNRLQQNEETETQFN